MKLLLAAVVTAAIAGCGFGVDPRSVPAQQVPVPGEEIGPIFPARGGGPPIECRGLTRDRCEGPGTITDGAAGISVRDVERVIVSCLSDRCDRQGGEFRIDVLLADGSTREIGRGGYGEAEQR